MTRRGNVGNSWRMCWIPFVWKRSCMIPRSNDGIKKVVWRTCHLYTRHFGSRVIVVTKKRLEARSHAKPTEFTEFERACMRAPLPRKSGRLWSAFAEHELSHVTWLSDLSCPYLGQFSQVSCTLQCICIGRVPGFIFWSVRPVFCITLSNLLNLICTSLETGRPLCTMAPCDSTQPQPAEIQQKQNHSNFWGTKGTVKHPKISLAQIDMVMHESLRQFAQKKTVGTESMSLRQRIWVRIGQNGSQKHAQRVPCSV